MELKEKGVLERKKTNLHILVLGRTGSGKSTLINAMLGDHLAQQSYDTIPTPHDLVEIHKCQVAGVNILLYDTPGFFDRRISTADLLFQLKAEYPNGFDLVILCQRFIDRFDETTVHTIESLCKHYVADDDDDSNQYHVVVALTFTNFFLSYNEVKELKYKEAKKEVLARKVADFKSLYNKTSAECMNGANFFEDIPFVITGTLKERGLPHTNDWLCDLWRACYQQCSQATKPLVNSLCFQLGLDTTAVGTATGLGSMSCMIVGAVVVVPEIATTISKVMESTSRFHTLKTKQQRVHVEERSSQDDTEQTDIQDQKYFDKSVCLPSAKAEELSNDIFEALGIK